MIQTKIDETVLKLAARDQYVLRMSGAGACLRQMEYDLQLPPVPMDFAGAKRTGAGTFMHTYWQKIFSQAFGPDFEHAEAEISIPIVVDGEATVILGHPDGKLTYEGETYTIEFKSVSELTYSMVVNQDHAIPEHFEQANIYADTLDTAKVLILYINRNSGDYIAFIYDRSKEIAQAVREKWSRAIRSRDEGKRTGQLILSPRPYQDPTESPCWFCSRKDLCYAGFEKEIKDAGKGPVPDEAVETVREYLQLRSERLRLEKQEEVKKTLTVKFLLDHKLNTAYLEKVQLGISVGKNGNPLLKLKDLKNE